MKKSHGFIVGILVLSLVVSLCMGGCKQETTSKLKVVTTTCLLEQIVERVGGDLVDVANIIPPAQCPGHFDVKPGDIQKLADAELFFMHGWQGEMFTQKLIDSADNPDLTVVTINIPGNWMTPPVQLQAIDEITAHLVEADAENAAAYQELAAEYKDRIIAKEAEIKAKLAQVNLSDVNVISVYYQVF